jgi:sugar lactone lactonase YvrE
MGGVATVAKNALPLNGGSITRFDPQGKKITHFPMPVECTLQSDLKAFQLTNIKTNIFK